MLGNFRNLLELQRYFTTEKICIEYLEKQIWAGEPTCPHCGAKNPYKTVTRSRHPELAGTLDYKCRNKACAKKFTAITGTVFENTKIEMKSWFAAIYIITAHKKGISSCQLARDISVTQKTAWFMLHRIREMLKDKMPEILEDIVQVDEVYVGGENKNRHDDKKIPGTQGRSGKDKTIVMGAIDLNKTVLTQVVPNVQALTLKPIIMDWVKSGSIVVTDEWKSYNAIRKEFLHVKLNHTQHEYVRGAFTTNNIENYWSCFSRSIYGIYHQVSPAHLQKYCEESAFRYNTRKLKDPERFGEAVSNCKGRLTYKQLVNDGKTKNAQKEAEQI